MTTIYDDFSTDPLGTRWGTLYAGTSEVYNDVNDDWDLSAYAAYHTTQLSTLINYTKVTLKYCAASDHGKIVLRSTGIGSDSYYGICFEWGGTQTAYLTYCDDGGWQADLDSVASPSVSNGDTLAVTITGTSTNTIIRCWLNPVNNTPTAVDGWDSAGDTCDFSFSAAGGWDYYCDTGKYVGLYNEETGTNTYDNFYAGDIGAGIAISPNASGHSHLAAQPAFTIERNVTPSASAHSHTAAQPTFTVERDITPTASAHSHVAEQAGVTSAVYDVSPAASLHSHVSAQPTFTIERNITPAAISHSHVAAEPVFTVERDISPETASHTHAVAEPVFTVERDINPVSTFHSHAAAQPEFTVKREIAPSVAAHSHTAAQPEFTFERNIAPSAVLHSHTATVARFVSGRSIIPSACQHTHAAQQPTFTFERDVAPIDSAHVHTADSAGFTLHLTVSVNNGTHGHTCETLAFNFVRSMDPVDSLHSHIAEYANAHETTGIMNYFGFNLFNGEVIMFRGRRTA